MNKTIKIYTILAGLFIISTLTGCTKEGPNGQIMLEGPVIGYKHDGYIYYGWASYIDQRVLGFIPSSSDEQSCEYIEHSVERSELGSYRGWRCKE